jgi:hypothetical protein
MTEDNGGVASALTRDNIPLSRPIFIDGRGFHGLRFASATFQREMPRKTLQRAKRSAPAMRRLGMILKQVRHWAASEHPYHVMEPIRNLALSAARRTA